MPGTPPTSKTFPPSITCSIVPPPPPPSSSSSSSSSAPANILILLHSIGDTQKSFAELAKNLSLPETTCISLCAPNNLPFGLQGYQWGEDVMFQGQDLSPDVKFEKAGFRTLRTVVDKLLEDGWKTREIFFFGWGQGAICIFDYLCREGSDKPGMASEFGGVVSIGGIIGSGVNTVVKEEEQKSNTPILVCGGRKGLVTGKAQERVKDLFKIVQIVIWDKDNDGLFQDAKEATPVMQFFSRRLLSRRGIPEGFTELPA